MKNINLPRSLKYSAFFGMLLIFSCKNNTAKLTTEERKLVTDSVTRMATNISNDISAKGPAAWLNYFENDPGFFMASGGMLVFRNYTVAKSYTLDTVAKNFKKISLDLANVKVDPLTVNYASLGADFHEDIVLANGQSLSVGGYVTATAHFDGSKWRLRNLNWAIKPPEKPAK
jgi:hypothetical protein